MTAAHFLDTDVLPYSISRDPAEQAKREIAVALLENDGGALSGQVLQELYVQATRSSPPDWLPHDIDAGLIVAWTRFPVQEITFSILLSALEIRAAHGFSYWDSAVLAAARALGCRTLYTEDISHGREVEGVTIIHAYPVLTHENYS